MLYTGPDTVRLSGDDVVLKLLAPETAESKAFYPHGLSGGRKVPRYIKVDMWRYRTSVEH